MRGEGTDGRKERGHTKREGSGRQEKRNTFRK